MRGLLGLLSGRWGRWRGGQLLGSLGGTLLDRGLGVGQRIAGSGY